MSMRRDPVTNAATFGSTSASGVVCAICVASFFYRDRYDRLSLSPVQQQMGRGVRSPSSGRPDPDGFDIEIFVELLDARLASVTTHLVPAKGDGRVHRLITVDPDRPGPDGPGQAMRLADIAG